MSSSSSKSDTELKVLSFNVWGLAVVSKERGPRIRAIAEHLRKSDYDIVCLQEVWVYKDYEIIRREVTDNLPFSRFFHTGALGSGLCIFTRFPLIAAQALPYSLSGSPAHAFAGDFFVKKAAGSITVLHPRLGEIEIWNTHMHAAGEIGPEVRQAHRIAESWQLANAIRSSAAKGRYVLCMGDFNSQPWSIPINTMRHHANMSDSFIDANPRAASGSTSVPLDAIRNYGMSCDSPLNSWSASKPIPGNITAQGGKRLDYIFYRQPAIARRRPLIWGYRDDPAQGTKTASPWSNGDATLEQGKTIPQSISSAPKLRCIKSEVVLTDLVPGQNYSYSDHFGLCSTFSINPPTTSSSTSSERTSSEVQKQASVSSTGNGSSFTPLIPLMGTEAEPLAESISDERPTTYAPVGPSSPSSSPRASTSSNTKSALIRRALNVLSDYSRISQKGARWHLNALVICVLATLGLTIGSAWQPKSWLQPIFTLVGAVLGGCAATFLYTGFVWGRWEMGLLTETIEEMELELRVVEMEDRGAFDT